MPYKDAEQRREYQRQWHIANADSVRSKVARWKAENPGRRADLNAAYRHRNAAEIARKGREYHATHREQRDAYRKLHPEHDRAANARRRGVPLDEQARDYAKILALDPCAYCGGPADEIDHIVPIVRGGTSEWGNLTAACKACNACKHARSLLRFLVVAVG